MQTKIVRKIKESHDTVSLELELSPSILNEFKSGQYLDLEFEINGKLYVRPYSVSSISDSSKAWITVKKINKGIVSNYIFDVLKEFDQIQFKKVNGKFFVVPNHSTRKAYYFIAAGVGITPIKSMIHSLLENEPTSLVHLFYANKTQEDILFYPLWLEWKEKYRDQFFVEFILSKSENTGGFFSFLSKKSNTWNGLKGRINELQLNRFLNEHPSQELESHFYICGPEEFNQSISSILKKSVPPSQIHLEYFHIEQSADTNFSPSGKKSHLKVKLRGKDYEFEIDQSKKIIDLLVEKKLNPPYSCSSGACATCIAKLHEGKVKMDVSMALDQEEIDQNWILSCQSRVISDTASIEFME
ncbi:MAG TPA: iron-sulfur cluster-binding domain-containing protein [Saprospiraceae bacterium]|nr:iron-sulfur cluster-binding domain-containing protein [Saprospiraceae bacterium]